MDDHSSVEVDAVIINAVKIPGGGQMGPPIHAPEAEKKKDIYPPCLG